MTIQDKVESLFQQITELPDEAQAELVQALIEMRAENLGIYALDDDDRATLGRFASDKEIEEIFAHYGR